MTTYATDNKAGIPNPSPRPCGYIERGHHSCKRRISKHSSDSATYQCQCRRGPGTGGGVGVVGSAMLPSGKLI
jgi:hypothetical protein